MTGPDINLIKYLHRDQDDHPGVDACEKIHMKFDIIQRDSNGSRDINNHAKIKVKLHIKVNLWEKTERRVI